jgi:hypothetical protein
LRSELRTEREVPSTARGTIRLPDFIAVGPPRTATTWLHVQLRDHVWLPSDKETQFFVWNYRLGIEWYAAHFRDCPPGRVAGEFAPTYFDSPEARARIAAAIPNCRIICTFRDPVERLYSHYKMWRRLGRIKADFEYVAFNHRQLRGYNRYAEHLAEWQRRFPSNVLVMFYEDLIADPQGFINQATDFIGIERVDLATLPRANFRIHSHDRAPKSQRLARRGRQLRDAMLRMKLYGPVRRLRPLWEFCAGRGEIFPPLDAELERRIRAELLPEIEAFERMVGRDLSTWKNGVADAPR